MTPSELDLHIDQLVLHGFAVGDRHLIAAAIQQELTRLFTEQGIPPQLMQGATISQLNNTSFDMAPGTKPEAIGSHIAQSIYGGFQL